MTFTPRFTDDTFSENPLGKIVCVGRNYADHAKELNNPVPTEPLLFIKPATSATQLDKALKAPFERGELHFETELALLVGEKLSNATPEQAERAVVGLGLALDLTLRDVQSRLKEKGHPWEVAKGFDGACPMTAFMRLSQKPDWSALSFSLHIDDELRQQGYTRDMLFPIPQLLVEMSRHFTLEPGDVILTGTPAGVGMLSPGVTMRLTLDDGFVVTTQVSS